MKGVSIVVGWNAMVVSGSFLELREIQEEAIGGGGRGKMK